MAKKKTSPPFKLSKTPVAFKSQSTPAYENLGELPTHYEKTAVYLVAYDPAQLFSYWDLDWNSVPAGAPIALQVYEAETGELLTRIELQRGETGRYIPVNAPKPGTSYFVELGYGRAEDRKSWHALATSAPASLPKHGLSQNQNATFVAIPFHLSFQYLVNILRGAAQHGEDIANLLAQLQNSETQPATLRSFIDNLKQLTPEQRQHLAQLLGLETGLDQKIADALTDFESASLEERTFIQEKWKSSKFGALPRFETYKGNSSACPNYPPIVSRDVAPFEWTPNLEWKGNLNSAHFVQELVLRSLDESGISSMIHTTHNVSTSGLP